MTWPSSDSRTPLRRPSIVGRIPILGSEPMRGNGSFFIIEFCRMVHPALKLTPEPGLVPPLSDFDEILRRMLAEVKAGRKSCAKIGLGTVLSLSSPTRRGRSEEHTSELQS